MAAGLAEAPEAFVVMILDQPWKSVSARQLGLFVAMVNVDAGERALPEPPKAWAMQGKP